MVTVGALAYAAPAAVADSSHGRRITIKHVRLDWSPARTAAENSARDAAARKASLPLFTSTIKDGASTFSYTIVGKNPFVTQAKPSSTITTVLVPLRIQLTGGATFDPSVSNNCDTATALSRTQNSPVFVAQKWKAGTAPLGKAQYVDAVQREQFYNFTKAGAINPGYHVKLKLTTTPTVTVNVPLADWASGTTVCGNGVLGAIEIGWFDNYVQHTLIPSIPNASTVFPLFLVENVIWYQGSPGNCCILGYHNAFATGGGKFQSYGVSIYDNTGDFSGSGDVSALTHEVSEWMNDPNVNNATKPWGHIGQVSGCQANFETGDPLSGTTINDTLNGKTYHLQELAFFSWFYHQKPSIGANGWYSSGGTFKKAAKPCS